MFGHRTMFDRNWPPNISYLGKDKHTLRAEPLLFLFALIIITRKKRLCTKSALSFEVAVAPILGLVISVYRGQTGFF